MNKFSEVINEAKTFNFPLTASEFKAFKIFINDLMMRLYSDRAVNISEDDHELIVYHSYDYEKRQMPGRDYSVLGKVNTNKVLINRMYESFKIQNFNHLKNFINKFCHDLFDEDGRFFKSNPRGFSVWDTIRFTEMKGEENEKKVCGYIKQLYGPESNPIREVTSSYKDMVLGIDITFNIDGQQKTCQVKPLSFENYKERGEVVVYSSGVMKNYKTDYIAFINTDKGKFLFFKNQGARFDWANQTVTLPYQNLVNKKYSTDSVDPETQTLS